MIDWRELRTIFLLLFMMMGLVGLGVAMSFSSIPLPFSLFEKGEVFQPLAEAPVSRVESSQDVRPIANPVLMIRRPSASIFAPMGTINGREMLQPSQLD